MKGSPFTRACQQLAILRDTGRADLHTHTTFSDGTCSPADLVEHAIKAGLKILAITDHDTTGGIEPGRTTAGTRIEIVSGVEITSSFRGEEVHLLGMFVRLNNSQLNAALEDLRQARRVRAYEIGRRLMAMGAFIEQELEALPMNASLGRRHIAKILVARGYARNLHGAFVRWLSEPQVKDVPKRRLPIGEAIDLVRAAGGVASLAHPSANFDEKSLLELRGLGLQAIECAYPWPTRAREKELRALAQAVGLEVTGGSDTHEPGPSRAVGASTISLNEVDRIRALAG